MEDLSHKTSQSSLSKKTKQKTALHPVSLNANNVTQILLGKFVVLHAANGGTAKRQTHCRRENYFAHLHQAVKDCEPFVFHMFIPLENYVFTVAEKSDIR